MRSSPQPAAGQTLSEGVSRLETMATRFDYGDGPMHYGVFREAEGRARGTVILIHGGFWRGTPEYFDGPTPLAEALVTAGFHIWQIEYRQLPNGGGWPATLDDTAAAIEHLAVAAAALGIDPGPTITVGHNAVVPLAGAVSLAGAVNLVLGEKENVGRGAVTDFLGGSSADHPDRYAAADPVLRITAGLPVRIVHGDRDDVVPINQSESYIAAAREAGQNAALTVIEGDHMAVIEPSDPAFPKLLAALDEILTLS
jgi:acetyl esterase/lipase